MIFPASVLAGAGTLLSLSWAQKLQDHTMKGAYTDTSRTPQGVLELARKQGARMVDIKFVDTFATWQHFSCPIGELSSENFTEGLGFDGSSIRGRKSIEASDMLAMPDPATAILDPF